ncbi:hypothetical protein BaRGS_00031887 [Batillaria attramentaria]|uniref:Uncharacterized protein n=1 Tax=Batillaria attramentaria TaxID=370345 RepID=A0ABD0JP72_9CAEN
MGDNQELQTSPAKLSTPSQASQEQIHQMFLACQMGKVDQVISMVKSEFPLASADGDGNTALHIACTHGQLKVVQELVRKLSFMIKEAGLHSTWHAAKVKDT